MKSGSPGPARDQVPVQVSGDAGPGGRTQVEADIKSVRAQQSTECLRVSAQSMHRFQVLLVGQFMQPGHVSRRGD